MARAKKSDTAFYDYFLWDTPHTQVSDEQLQLIATKACRDYKSTRETTCLTVFYPYSDLKSTIKIDRGQTRIRISDILCEAPEEILDALIHILIARALHRKPCISWMDAFNEYIHRPEIEASHARIRQARNRKILSHPKGTYHDLEASFERVNQRYFEGKLTKPKLSWSPTRSRRQLGYHDAALNLIVISRYLDRRNVPVFMVDYIMYHELLHTVIRPEIRSGKRIVHSAEFKLREREFEHIDKAMRWLGNQR